MTHAPREPLRAVSALRADPALRNRGCAHRNRPSVPGHGPSRHQAPPLGPAVHDPHARADPQAGDAGCATKSTSPGPARAWFMLAPLPGSRSGLAFGPEALRSLPPRAPYGHRNCSCRFLGRSSRRQDRGPRRDDVESLPGCTAPVRMRHEVYLPGSRTSMAHARAAAQGRGLVWHSDRKRYEVYLPGPRTSMVLARTASPAGLANAKSVDPGETTLSPSPAARHPSGCATKSTSPGPARAGRRLVPLPRVEVWSGIRTGSATKSTSPGPVRAWSLLVPLPRQV
jgi:hypothetical protein